MESFPIESIERRIYLIRGHKVMLDAHLAKLYGVRTKDLNKAVRRNLKRFPSDFVFILTESEARNLRFQFGTSSWGGRRYFPYAFTEQGVAMLSSVLRSQRAALVNVSIMRAFVRLREMVSANKELAMKLAELERRIDSHDNHIQNIFEAIRRLMDPPEAPRRQIGFQP